ncbi:MAG: hypothetical protein Q8R82_07810 [Hyphomonadaceae bacterium]|nr:hypothetical protein [Hyphomonadaceae bacterium]
MSLEINRPDAPRAQGPKSEKTAPSPAQPGSQEYLDRLRMFSSLARKHREAERDRRSESQWRKRSCALMLGLFKESEPDPESGRHYTDEAALDAFAPHGSELIEDRYFTAEMEERERDAWSLVMSARQKDDAAAHEAHRTYLRFVEAMDKAALAYLRTKALTGGDTRSRFAPFKGMSGPPRLKGALRVRRLAQ